MFAYDGRNLPRLSSYNAAVEFFAQAQTWRGDSPDGERKLDGAKRHTTIRKDGDGSIACRMYHTDVITYHPDNTITVVPWGSRSTDEFFNALTRSIYGLSSSFTSGVIRVGERFYRAIDTMLIRLDPLEMVTKTEPFRFSTINRKRATVARKLYSYDDFAAYARMAEKMGVRAIPSGERYSSLSSGGLLRMLKSREYWPHLLVPAARCLYADVAVSAALTLSDIRDAVYHEHPDVYDRTEEPYLESWYAIARWKKQ